jgi:16S rRNA (guanine527-N7)-methyltransferase
MPLPFQLVRDTLAPFGIPVTESVASQISRYVDLLLQWNQKVSLTAITRPAEVLERHFGESFLAAAAVPIEKGRLADVGAGAGFPGLALKLVVPELSVRLIEPHLKKAVFLAEVCRQLALDGVDISRHRFEELDPEQVQADFITARAVGDYERLGEWAQMALRPGGRLILWLGAEDAELIARQSGWTWRATIPLPGSRERVLLIGQAG